jgi:hypothetical protein
MAVEWSHFKAEFKAIVFDPIDKDGNGTLDVQEVGAKLLAIANKTGDIGILSAAGDPAFFQDQAKSIIKEMDANGDGSITFDELFAVFVEKSPFQDEAAFAADWATRFEDKGGKEAYDCAMAALKEIVA